MPNQADATLNMPAPTKTKRSLTIPEGKYTLQPQFKKRIGRTRRAHSAELSSTNLDDDERCRRAGIWYRNDFVRERSQANVQRLIEDATSSSSSKTSALLAKKALQYRKVLDRMTGVDIDDPSFSATEFIGKEWMEAQSACALRQ